MASKLEQINIPYPGRPLNEGTYFKDLEEKIKEIWKMEMERCRDFNYWKKKYWKEKK